MCDIFTIVPNFSVYAFSMSRMLLHESFIDSEPEKPLLLWSAL